MDNMNNNNNCNRMSNTQNNLIILREILIIVSIIGLLLMFYIHIKEDKEHIKNIESSLYRIETTQQDLLNSYNRGFIVECNLE